MKEEELKFYTKPFRKSKYSGWVRDNKGNFVFQFESEFDDKGDYAKGCLEMQDRILSSINSDEHKPIPELNLMLKSAIEIFNGEKHLITIRGWGNLTGISAHNFPAEKAAKIQDDFAQWLLYKLSK